MRHLHYYLRIINLLRDQRGAMTAIIALTLPVLLGMSALVVDLGRSWQVRRQLQNCADAAALAGAWELADGAAAVNVAQSYLSQQGPQGCGAPGSPAPMITPFDRNSDGVDDALEVIVFEDVPYSFGRILGVDVGNVAARAVAGKNSPRQFNGMEPFGLQVDPNQVCGQADITGYYLNGEKLTYGKDYIIKYSSGPGSGSPGNFQAMALGGTGGNVYRDNVENGYQGWVATCDIVTTETGNMVGPTMQGLNDRIKDDVSHSDPWQEVIVSDPPVGHARWTDCPRVINIAIVPPLDPGRKETTVLTFGWFLITDYERDGNQSAQITGRFIDTEDRAAPPEEWIGDDPFDPNSNQPIGVKLVE